MVLKRICDWVVPLIWTFSIQIYPIQTLFMPFLCLLLLLQLYVRFHHSALIEFLGLLVLIWVMVEDIWVIVPVYVVKCPLVFEKVIIYVVIMHFLLFREARINEGISLLYFLFHVVQYSVFFSHDLSHFPIMHPLLVFLSLQLIHTFSCPASSDPSFSGFGCLCFLWEGPNVSGRWEAKIEKEKWEIRFESRVMGGGAFSVVDVFAS